MHKIIAVNSRDNRNVSSLLIKFFKYIGLAPKTHPSIAVDCAMIMQEIFYKQASECGEVIDGRRMVFCTAESLGSLLPHLSLSSIFRRLILLVDNGLLCAEKVKKSRCWQAMWYRINTDFWQAESIDTIDFSLLKDRFLTDEKSESNNTPLSKPNKREERKEPDRKNSFVVESLTTIQEDEPKEEQSCQATKINTICSIEYSNSEQDKKPPEVDEKINKEDTRREALGTRSTKKVHSDTSVSTESSSSEQQSGEQAESLKVPSAQCLVPSASKRAKPILKKDMKHEPKYDKYINHNNQQTEIRDRAKSYSALGHSAFESVEQMQECQIALAKYYAQKLDSIAAAEKAKWTIKGEKDGERSPFVDDFLKGNAIGTSCMREWDVEPGRVAPVLLAYLRCKLRRDGDTHAQSIDRVTWQLKDSQAMTKHWAECKRLIAIEEPRLRVAIQLGQNPVALQIPEWIIETFRPETTVESVTNTAIALGEIATEYNKAVEQSQSQLQIPAAVEEEIPVTIPGGVTLDFVKQISAGQSENLPLSPEHEVDQLLSDPLTRLEGSRLARRRNIPLVVNTEGVPIAVDFVALEDRQKRQNVDQVMDKVSDRSSAISHQKSEVRSAENLVPSAQCPMPQKTTNPAHKLFNPEELPPVTTSFRDIAQMVREKLKQKK